MAQSGSPDESRPATPGSDVVLGEFDWLGGLSDTPAIRDRVVGELHAILLRVARAETRRRSHRLGLAGPELDDVANQAADDALIAILGKLGQFRGESRFTTWACKFVIFDVANKVSRHHWQRNAPALDVELWDRLPARVGSQPESAAETAELVGALRQAVARVLTDRQRKAFVSVLVNGMPIEVHAEQTGSNRNAVYKIIFDARRKIRAALVANGHIEGDAGRGRSDSASPAAQGRPTVTGWLALERLLETDPRDGGCAQAMAVLDVYADLAAADAASAAGRYPQVAAHVRACGPCAEDLEGLLRAVDTARDSMTSNGSEQP